MADPASVTRDVFDFAGAAQDGFQRCNADKASALRVLDGGAHLTEDETFKNLGQDLSEMQEVLK